MKISQPVVAVGVDASPEALVAARYAGQLAVDLGLVLRLVHAYAMPPSGPSDKPGSSDPRRRLASAETAAHFLVDDVTRQLELPAETVVERVVQLRAVEALLSEQVAVVDVLVVGQAHQLPGPRHRRIGGAVDSRAASSVLVGAIGAVTVVPLGWTARRVRPEEFRQPGQTTSTG